MIGRLRPVILFNHCDLIWAVLCIPGIPGLWHSLGSQSNFPYWASFWLTDFGRLDLSFSLWNFKAFSLYGSLDPNSLDFFHPSLLSFFFFFHYRIAQCVIFLWALGCGSF